MTDRVDFFSALAGICAHADLFPAGADAARQAVLKIVGAQLAAEDATLASVTQIRAAVGAGAFAEAVDGVPATKIKGLVARIDPHASGLTTAPARVLHLLALADGSRLPESASPKKAGKRTGRGKAASPDSAPVPAHTAEEAPTEARPPRKRRMSGRTALTVSDRAKR
ncbi:hypothetical protein [Xanthobacter sp. ZOL 2024]